MGVPEVFSFLPLNITLIRKSKVLEGSQLASYEGKKENDYKSLLTGPQSLGMSGGDGYGRSAANV